MKFIGNIMNILNNIGILVKDNRIKLINSFIIYNALLLFTALLNLRFMLTMNF